MTVIEPGTSADDALAALFFTAEGLEDPAPIYRHLRDTAPVHRSATGAIFLTRFDDCQQVLRDNRLGKSSGRGNGLIPQSDEESARIRQAQAERNAAENRPTSMLFLNPPDHTRQRRLVSRAFTPRRVEQLRSSIRGLAEAAVERLADAGEGDLLELIAFPLPVAVIGTMVGVPEADWPQFRGLITTAAAGIEPGASPDDLRAAEAVNVEIGDYFDALVAERRKSPQDDLLSDLIAVEEAGDALSHGEILSVAALLFAAGFETTTNLIGNGMGALLKNPDEHRRLRDDRSLVTSAVDEMLRWDSPVQLDIRTALEPADLLGEPLAPGETIVTLLGAANRDPAQFSDPERFDITRDEGPPMSFASGIHYCLGANLARAEGQEVFGALVDRFASIELDGDLVRRNRMTLRGYESVPVRAVPR